MYVRKILLIVGLSAFFLAHLTRWCIFRSIKTRLRSIIGGNIILKSGHRFLSIKYLKGSGPMGSIYCTDIDIHLSLINILKINDQSFIQVSIKSLDISILQFNKHPRADTNVKFSRWVLNQILFVALSLIVRSVQVDMHSIALEIGKEKMRFNKGNIRFIREGEEFVTKVSIFEIGLSNPNPILRIPIFMFSITGQSGILMRFFKRSAFFVTFSPIRAILENGKLDVRQNDIDVNLYDDESPIKVTVSSFVCQFPVLNIYTTNLMLSVSDLVIKRNTIECGSVEVSRSGSQVIFSLPSARICDRKFTTESVYAMIPLTLCIDYRVLKKLYDHPFFLGYVDISKYWWTSGKVDVRFSLSDEHVLWLELKNSSLQNMSLIAKRFSLSFMMTSGNHKIIYGNGCQLDMSKTHVSLKCVSMDVSLDSEFSEYNHINEVINIVHFIFDKEDEVNEPPIKKVYSFHTPALTVTLTKPCVVQGLHKANVAKMDAMYELCLRRSKAIQILKTKGMQQIDEVSFEQASKKLLFDLFKKKIDVMPEEEPHMVKVSISGFDFILDGPSMKNRRSAIEKLESIQHGIGSEEIGRILGGNLTIFADNIEVFGDKLGKICHITEWKHIGPYFKVRPIGVKKSDFYHFQITCDSGAFSFLIPGLSSRSVHIFEFSATAGTCSILYTAAMSEFIADIKLIMKVFRMKKFKHRRLCLLETLRMRTRSKFDVEIREITVNVNRSSNPFSSVPYAKVVLNGTSIEYFENELNVKSDAIQAFLNSGKDFQRVFSMPGLNADICIYGTNEGSPLPLFIPVNSCLADDVMYDPYADYRSDGLCIKSNVSFSGNNLLVDYDQLLTAVSWYKSTPSHSESWIYPESLLSPSILSLKIKYYDINIQVPNITLTSSQGLIVMQISNNAFVAHVRSDIVSITSPEVGLSLIKDNVLIMTAIADTVKFTLSDSMVLTIDSLRADSDTEIFHLPYTLPFGSGKMTHLPDLFTESELLSHFSKERFIASIPKINISLIQKDSVLFSFHFDTFRMKQSSDDNNSLLNTYSLSALVVSDFTDRPIITMCETQFLSATSKLVSLRVLTMTSAVIIVRQDDIDQLSPFIKKIFNFLIVDAKTSKLLIDIKSISLSLALASGASMATIAVEDLDGKLMSLPDESQTISLTLARGEITTDTVTDNFRQIFEHKASNSPFFAFFAQKTPKVAKFPVYQKVELKIDPFTLRLSTTFLKELISQFPITEELRVFDLEAEENEKQSSLEDQHPDPDKIDPLYCREFIIHPFKAELDIRQKVDDVFKDYHNRGVDYRGLKLYDVFGTNEEILVFVKQNIKTTVAKTLPGLFMGKKKREVIEGLYLN